MNQNQLEKTNNPAKTIETKKLIDELLQSFDGVKITNSEGKEITLTSKFKRVAAPISTEATKIELWLIEFKNKSENYPDFEETQDNVRGQDPLIGNYIEIGGDPYSKRIVIAYALLNHPDLRGKEVFTKFKALLAEKLNQKPYVGFKIYAEIDHKKMKSQLREIFRNYQESKISREKMEELILNNQVFQGNIKLGYNKFFVNFEGNDAELIEVTYEKDSNVKNPSIDITVNGSPFFT